MSSKSLATEICNQIAAVFANPTATPAALNVLVDEISAASYRNGAVFVYGVGREGLMLKALCMRLGHLGLRAHCVFDMTTPPIGSGDLLVASAGPGGFSTVDAICRVARSSGARVAVLTAQPGSSWACVREHAHVVAHVPAQTMADDNDNDNDNNNNNNREEDPDPLPMGSLYEGALYVLFEMVVFELTKTLGQTPDIVRARHTNLE